MNRLLVTLVVLGAPAAAQAVPLPLQDRVHWPYDAAFTFGRAEVGRFTPFSGRSVAQQWGNGVYMAFAPLVHDMCPLMTAGSLSPITAFVTSPAAPDEDRDSLLVANSEGLWLVRLVDPLPSIPDSAPKFQMEWLTAKGTRARDLVCVDLDADGDLDVVYVDEAGGAVHVLERVGSQFNEQTSFASSGTTIQDIEPIRWDDTNPPELAVLSSWGTDVFRTSGERLWGRFSGYVGEHCMAVIEPPLDSQSLNAPPPATDKLAIVQPTQNGMQSLSIFWASGNRPAFNLGPIGVVNMDAGDHDGDGDQDLALALTTALEVRILWNVGGAFSNANSTDKAIGDPSAVSALNNHAEVCLEDLNDDGIADLFSACDADNWLAAVPGAPTVTLMGADPCPFVFQRYDVRSGLHPRNAEYCDVNDCVWPASSGGIELEILNVWGQLPSPSTTHLELILWGIEANPVGDYHETGVDRHSILHALYAIPTDSLFRTTPDSPLFVGFGLNAFADPLVDPPSYFASRYYVEVRPVKWNGTAIVNPKASYCGGFTFSDGASADHLIENAGSGYCLVPLAINGQGQFTLNSVRGWVDQPRIPPKLRPNLLPIIDPPHKVSSQSN